MCLGAGAEHLHYFSLEHRMSKEVDRLQHLVVKMQGDNPALRTHGGRMKYGKRQSAFAALASNSASLIAGKG